MKIRWITIVTCLLVTVCLFPVSVLANGLVVDQKCQGSGDIGYYILDHSPTMQEFVPSMSPLVAVEIYLRSGEGSSANITVNIREDTPAGAIVATKTQVIPDVDERAWYNFEFPSDVSVDIGRTYLLEVASDNGSHLWYAINADLYHEGRLYRVEDFEENQDFIFRTYSYVQNGEPPEPGPEVGGDIYPANKFIWFAPAVVLAVVLFSGTLLVFNRRKIRS